MSSGRKPSKPEKIKVKSPLRAGYVEARTNWERAAIEDWAYYVLMKHKDEAIEHFRSRPDTGEHCLFAKKLAREFVKVLPEFTFGDLKPEK